MQYKWQLVAAAIIAYLVTLCLYRRFFHPLAKVPGPFFAAVTKLYQSAYNKQYYKHIARLHEKYGPVIRITPNEIHLSDPENYDKIYHQGSKYAKSPNFYNALCVPNSAFGLCSNELHRIRRGALNPMFSHKRVQELESVIRDKALTVCKLMQEGMAKRVPVDLHHAFRALSMDTTSDYAFNKSYHFLDKEDLGAYFFRMSHGIGPALWIFQQFPSFQAAALKTPPWLTPYLSRPLEHVTSMQQECLKHVEDVKRAMAAGKLSDRPTIFSTLLMEKGRSDRYPTPSILELKDEAYAVLMASAETTGNAMTVAAFHVIGNPTIYQSLVRELREAFPDAETELQHAELEKLPYLTGIIKEALRLSFGVIGRLPRVVPDPGATFNGYYVPGGTIVGMSAWIMHRNPDIFPDPMKFRPERWLDAESCRRLDRHMVPFGRGSRMCIGMPLACCELYVTLGAFFRRFHDLEVFETTPADMEYDDFFTPFPVEGSKLFKAIARPTAATIPKS